MTDAPGRHGVLLINLGTPDAPTTAAVRRYLREFLTDPRVIDIPPLWRWILVYLIILPRRPARSAAAYRKIWGPDGSPLRVHGEALARGVAAQLPDAEVALAMRYGAPSIEDGLSQLAARGCDRVTVLPLYPQYAASSTGSTLERVYELAARLWNTPNLRVIPPFYADPGFLDAAAQRGRDTLASFPADHVLFSFHGLPERQIHKSDRAARCLRDGCCDQLTDANLYCYRAQCFFTAHALASRMGLARERYTICFQSRLGRTPWIRPFTDELLVSLPAQGVRRLAVLCPAFVADCLETLEEIGLRAAADFKAAGGEELRLVPAVNAEPAWIDAVARMVAEPGPRLPVLPDMSDTTARPREPA